MRTLFLHGMGARPKEWQLQSLIDLGLEAYALHLDYSRVPEFDILSEYIEKHNIEFLVGRSHGGYLAFWLAQKYSLPCLIINPHFSLRLKKQMDYEINDSDFPICLVVLGSDDVTVDSHRSLKYLSEKRFENKNIKVCTLKGVGHPLDYDTFNNSVQWALDEIKILNNEHTEPYTNNQK